MVTADEDLAELIDQLERTTQLSRGVLTRLVADVLEHYDETVEVFVRHRHRQLQATGMSNPAIWDRLAVMIAARRFRAVALSPRQLRRIVYG